MYTLSAFVDLTCGKAYMSLKEKTRNETAVNVLSYTKNKNKSYVALNETSSGKLASKVDFPIQCALQKIRGVLINGLNRVNEGSVDRRSKSLPNEYHTNRLALNQRRGNIQ